MQNTTKSRTTEPVASPAKLAVWIAFAERLTATGHGHHAYAGKTLEQWARMLDGKRVPVTTELLATGAIKRIAVEVISDKFNLFGAGMSIQIEPMPSAQVA